MIIEEAEKEINNIDKEKPEVTIEPTQTTYEVLEGQTTDISIKITATDTGVSGLDIVQYEWAKEGEEVTYIDFTNEVTINKTGLEVGKYNLYLKVTDNAGNISDIEQVRYTVKVA